MKGLKKSYPCVVVFLTLLLVLQSSREIAAFKFELPVITSQELDVDMPLEPNDDLKIEEEAKTEGEANVEEDTNAEEVADNDSADNRETSLEDEPTLEKGPKKELLWQIQADESAGFTSYMELKTYIEALQPGADEVIIISDNIVVPATVGINDIISIPAGVSITLTDDGQDRTFSYEGSAFGMFVVEEGAVLTIQDSKNSEEEQGSLIFDAQDAPIESGTGSFLTVYGKAILNGGVYKNITANNINFASAMYVKGENAQLVMNNGEIAKNSFIDCYAGAPIIVYGLGDFTMENGLIHYNNASADNSAGAVLLMYEDVKNSNNDTIDWHASASFHMSDGLISDNKGYFGAVGLCNLHGVKSGVGWDKYPNYREQHMLFEMTGGIISYNEAIRFGGALGIMGRAKAYLSNGEFIGNKASVGGAIALTDLFFNSYRGTVSYNKNGYARYVPHCFVEFEMNNCMLKDNEAEFSDPNDEPSGFGGAMYLNNHHNKIKDCQIQDNKADKDRGFGGGIFFDYYAMGDLEDCTVSGNYAGRAGGGIYFRENDIEMKNINVSDNVTDGYGGGLCYLRNMTIKAFDIEVTGNKALGEYPEFNTGSGGGIYAQSGGQDIKFNGLILKNNYAEFNGGGMYKGVTSPDFIVSGLTVEGNTAVNDGGGIYAFGEFHIPQDSVITDNRAGVNGGGVFLTENNNDYNGYDAIIGERTIIQGNLAGSNGGGVCMDISVPSGANPSNYQANILIAPDVKVLDNASQNGGGIFFTRNDGCNAEVSLKGEAGSPVVIRNNAAKNDGGGIYTVDYEQLKLDFVQFSRNRASAGYPWDIDAPPAGHEANAQIYQNNVSNASFTEPFENAYSNYDVNYEVQNQAVHVLTYWLNDGSGNPHAVQTVADGQKADAVAPPQNGEMRFLDWYEDAGGETKFDMALLDQVRQSYDLYAKWGPPVYEVIYYPNTDEYSGSTVDNLSPYEKDVTVTVLECGFVKPNFKFIGWSHTEDGSADIQPGTDFVMPQENVVFYAVWEPLPQPVTYQVTYNPNGGNGEIYIHTGLEPGDYTLLDGGTLGFRWEGYMLLGWSTNADASTPEYGEDSRIELKEDMTFFAIWSKLPDYPMLTVTYHANGGTGGKFVENTVVKADYTIRRADEVQFKREGYTFQGWSLTADGTADISYMPETILQLEDDLTLFAVWSPSSSGRPGGGSSASIRVTYYWNDGTDSIYRRQFVARGSRITAPAPPVREGYTFEGWFLDKACTDAYDFSTLVNRNLDLYAKWLAEEEIEEEEKKITKGILNLDDHFAYIVGYPDSTVRPNTQITRGEVATIFFRLLDEQVRNENLVKTNIFYDVAQGDWYNNAVSTLAGLDIVAGYQDGSFHPNAPITRAEVAAIAVRFEQEFPQYRGSFSDILGHWAQESILHSAALGWVTGYPDGSFRPDAPITRAEMMTMVNRVLERQVNSTAQLADGYIRWPDNPETSWYYYEVIEATNAHDYETIENKEYWTKIQPIRNWAELEQG